MIELWDPDVFVEAPPHEFLAELRRTQPVYWQDMPDEPGFWAVLKHADLTAVAREPVLFSASEGGVVLENLDETGSCACATCSWRWTRRATSPTGARSCRASRRKVIGAMDGRIRTICRGDHANARGEQRASSSSTTSPPTCRRRSSASSSASPARTGPRIQAWAERNTSGQDTEITEATPTPSTATRTSTWRCTRSSSPRSAVPSRRAKTFCR